MQRLLIIVLLLIVPLQTGLAAICGYCAHAERAEAGSHALVHGAAQPAQAAAADAADDTATDQTGDVECALCHLGCGSAITAQVSLPAVDLPATAPPHQSAPYEPAHFDRIYRVPLPAARSS